MSEIFLLYLMMQADSISGSIFFVCAVSAVLIFGLSIFLFDADDDSEVAIKAKKTRKAALWFFAISLLGNALFPSTKTIAVMAGGHYAIQAARSETGEKVKKLIDATLDKALEKVAK